MSHRLLHLSVATLLLLAVGAGSALAQQYGRLYGVTVDENGDHLTGVTVILTGMGAPRVAITDAQGGYRFLNLDPGTYSLEAALDGFSTVQQPSVVLTLSRSTTINFTLTASIGDAITVTSESPLLDQRRMAEGTVLSLTDLDTIPTARDPWSLLNRTPGVLTDRINVGGSETGDQARYNAPGVDFSQNEWTIDGISITDSHFLLGATVIEPGLEQYEAVELSTGGADVTKSAAGVSLNLVTRRGTNGFRGSAHVRSARGDGLGFLGQSSSSFDCSDLSPNQSCDEFEVSSINRVGEQGFEAGGPAIADRLWFWGSYGIRDIDRVAPGGNITNLKMQYEDTIVKANGQLGDSNSAVLSWNNGDKVINNRGAGPTRATETTWDQRGPSAIWKFEDTHVFNSRLFVTGSFSKNDLGFSLATKANLAAGGNAAAPEALWASDGVWRQNYLSGFGRLSSGEIRLDGSYFFNAGNTAHELKFGGRTRESEGANNFVWPGSGVVNIAGENFGGDGSIDYFFIQREADLQYLTNTYSSLWVQDTISRGNWTLNAGLRYDLQDGEIDATITTPVHPEFQDIMPTLTTERTDPGFDWSSIVPRLGLTYALGEQRDTLLRASFSQFAEALGTNTVAHLNPAATYNYAYFLFFDSDGDDQWVPGDFSYFLFADGFNIDDPLAVVNGLDPNLDPEITTELVLGVEHSLLPELVVGASYTYRKIDDVRDEEDLITGPGISDPLGRPWTAADFISDGPVTSTLPTVIADGSTRTVETFTLSPEFSRTGGTYLRNGTRSREYNGLSLTINKRLANRWSLRGFVNWGETKWNVPPSHAANSDPNDLQTGADNDGAVYFINSNGSGRGQVFLQSSWQANLAGIYQVAIERPWGFTFSGNFYAREGYPVPYDERVFGSTDNVLRNISLLGKNLHQFRSDDVFTTDLRVEKQFSASGNTSLTLGIDLFNAFNEATVLSRQPTLTGGDSDFVQDLIAPRIWKVGVKVSWK